MLIQKPWMPFQNKRNTRVTHLATGKNAMGIGDVLIMNLDNDDGSDGSNVIVTLDGDSL